MLKLMKCIFFLVLTSKKHTFLICLLIKLYAFIWKSPIETLYHATMEKIWAIVWISICKIYKLLFKQIFNFKFMLVKANKLVNVDIECPFGPLCVHKFIIYMFSLMWKHVHYATIICKILYKLNEWKDKYTLHGFNGYKMYYCETIMLYLNTVKIY